MKEWVEVHQRSAIICGLTLLVPLCIVLYLLLGFWQAYTDYQSDIDYLEPRIARLEGLLARADSVREGHDRAMAEFGSLVYPASEDRAAASANLQSVVRQIFTSAGLSVSNSQVLPVSQQGGFDYMGLKLTVRGGLDAFDDALQALADFQPLLLVTQVDIKPGRASRSKPDEQTLAASVQVLSLRAVQ